MTQRLPQAAFFVAAGNMAGFAICYEPVVAVYWCEFFKQNKYLACRGRRQDGYLSKSFRIFAVQIKLGLNEHAIGVLPKH